MVLLRGPGSGLFQTLQKDSRLDFLAALLLTKQIAFTSPLVFSFRMRLTVVFINWRVGKGNPQVLSSFSRKTKAVDLSGLLQICFPPAVGFFPLPVFCFRFSQMSSPFFRSSSRPFFPGSDLRLGAYGTDCSIAPGYGRVVPPHANVLPF